jgi:dynein heavy chain
MQQNAKGILRILGKESIHCAQLCNLALIQMVIHNLQKLEQLLCGAAKNSNKKDKSHRNIPLFKVSASLSAPEIAIFPMSQEIYKMIFKFVRSIVDSTKMFIRWLNGSCILTPPQKVEDEEHPLLFTFHSDVAANPTIIMSINSISASVNKSFTEVHRWIDVWRKYRPLWKVDKVVTLEKFVQKKPSIVNYDEKLQLYSKLANDVMSQTATKDIDFIRVVATSLQNSIHQEAESWVACIGQNLNSAALEMMNQLEEKFTTYQENISRHPESLDDLTFVLNVISEVSDAFEEVETKTETIMESYRTLKMYKLKINPEEQSRSDKLPESWSKIRELARNTDRKLISVKEKFSIQTKSQVESFKKLIHEFKENFIISGPGAVGQEMDKGLILLKEAQETIQKYSETRESLVRAEKLFNMSITSYPELFEIEHQIKDLVLIYSLYEDVKNVIQGWSSTLWINLDINTLTKGIETFTTRLKKLPPELKQLPPYNAVAEKIVTFKDSIPLFADLKNEALRDRHWKTLMQITGKTFDMSPDTFTLEKLFAMNLFEHSEKIQEIVGGAAKELSIELALKEIEGTWKNLKFTIVRYMKGVEDRGFILGAIDEIMTTLDDNTMSLQSMSASRFVTAFLPAVQQWEKVLSRIAEVADVWMVVQRKWMYLESIFIGAGDIRMQLPEEAAKFDRIDKTFKKLMAETAKHSLVVEACNAEGRLELLNGLSEDLEACQKSLSDYLQSKRNVFPRFFFISDEELLSILGSHDPRNVQEHIIKMFDNVLKLNFGTGKHEKFIVGMSSSEGETLPFNRFVQIEGRVEEWMTRVEAEMKRSNRLLSKSAIYNYASVDRLEWLKQNLGMVGLVGSQVWWTWEVEDVFQNIKGGNKLAMKKYSKTLGDQLDQLVINVRSPLSSNERKKINAQIIVDVHARDIVDRFVRDSIMDANEFEWESQLRVSRY